MALTFFVKDIHHSGQVSHGALSCYWILCILGFFSQLIMGHLPDATGILENGSHQQISMIPLLVSHNMSVFCESVPFSDCCQPAWKEHSWVLWSRHLLIHRDCCIHIWNHASGGFGSQPLCCWIIFSSAGGGRGWNQVASSSCAPLSAIWARERIVMLTNSGGRISGCKRLLSQRTAWNSPGSCSAITPTWELPSVWRSHCYLEARHRFLLPVSS